VKKILSGVELLQAVAGVYAFNVLHLGNEVRDRDTVSIGTRVYECDDQAAPTIVSGRVRVPVFNGYAEATLNFDDSQNVVDGNTVTVGAKVYTFKGTLSNVDGYVKIGPTIHRSIYNLVAALNVGNVGLYDPPLNYGDKNDVGEGAGIAYAAATTKNAADVEAGYGNDFDLFLSHRAGGAIGGSIALGETLVGNAAWVEGNSMSDVPYPTADQFGTALTTALNNDPDGPVWAEKISASEVVVWSRRRGDVRLACAESFTLPGNEWEWPTLQGGVIERDALVAIRGARRVVSAEEAGRQRMYFIFGFDPAGALLQVRTSIGAHVAFDGAVTLNGRRVTVTPGTVAITAGHVFNLMVFQ
jgi:hypothetical protein